MTSRSPPVAPGPELVAAYRGCMRVQRRLAPINVHNGTGVVRRLPTERERQGRSGNGDLAADAAGLQGADRVGDVVEADGAVDDGDDRTAGEVAGGTVDVRVVFVADERRQPLAVNGGAQLPSDPAGHDTSCRRERFDGDLCRDGAPALPRPRGGGTERGLIPGTRRVTPIGRSGWRVRRPRLRSQ